MFKDLLPGTHLSIQSPTLAGYNTAKAYFSMLN